MVEHEWTCMRTRICWWHAHGQAHEHRHGMDMWEPNWCKLPTTLLRKHLLITDCRVFNASGWDKQLANVTSNLQMWHGTSEHGFTLSAQQLCYKISNAFVFHKKTCLSAKACGLTLRDNQTNTGRTNSIATGVFKKDNVLKSANPVGMWERHGEVLALDVDFLGQRRYHRELLAGHRFSKTS